MNTPAPTPRADAEEYTVETMANHGMGDEYDHHVVDVEFARTLERENAELEQENAKLRAQPYLTEQEDRAFESWYGTYNPAHKADKQRARDAYAAGMGDPLVISTTAQADSVQEDAARYRWLRERSSTMFVNISINGNGAEIAETLDSAVDAARKQGEKQ